VSGTRPQPVRTHETDPCRPIGEEIGQTRWNPGLTKGLPSTAVEGGLLFGEAVARRRRPLRRGA